LKEKVQPKNEHFFESDSDQQYFDVPHQMELKDDSTIDLKSTDAAMR
jgi:hypothetical protein